MAGDRICPECDSTDIELNTGDMLSIFGVDAEYICRSCGHTARQFPMTGEADDDLAPLEDQVRDAAEETADGPDTAKIALAVVMLLLGLGSLAYVRTSLQGVWGALLIPVAGRMLYRELM